MLFSHFVGVQKWLKKQDFKKTKKKHTWCPMASKSHPKSQKSTPERPKVDVGVIFAPFSLPFLLPFRKTSIFWKHAYSLGRARYLRFWHLIFSSKIHSKIMFFRDAFLDLIFLPFMLICCEKVGSGDQLGIRWGPKWRPKSPKWRQKAPKKHLGRALFGALVTELLPGSF